MKPNLTVNAGLRWDPYLPYYSDQKHLNHFSIEQFRSGVRSTVYKNAPAGLLWPGDSGFPKGKTGLDPQWWNISPRIGIAWQF